MSLPASLRGQQEPVAAQRPDNGFCLVPGFPFNIHFKSISCPLPGYTAFGPYSRPLPSGMAPVKLWAGSLYHSLKS
jgi:hypothetical protein